MPDSEKVGHASSLSKHKDGAILSNSLSSSLPPRIPPISADPGNTHPAEPRTITAHARQPVNIKFIDPWKSSVLNMQKRHLPHLSAIDATYFVTFRCQLGMSMPEHARSEVLSAVLHWNGRRIDLDAAVVMPDHVHIIFRLLPPESEGDKEEDVFSFDKLEACPTMMENRDSATADNKDERAESGEEEDVLCFDKLEACPTLSKIVHSIKSFSANRINRITGRKGAFWLHENFDHIIRNETDWREKIRYIIENPVKKELVDRPELYKWLWVRKDIEIMIEDTYPKDRDTNSIINE